MQSGKLAHRLILNHLIVLSNVFGIKPAILILEFKLNKNQWKVIKPFLLFLNYIKKDEYPDIIVDKKILDILKKI